VSLPVDDLWQAFADVDAWPRWNPCIRRAGVRGGTLRLGSTLVWTFNPIRRWYPYLMPAKARIIEHDHHRRVTWEVKFPGFHARHSYLFDDRGDEGSRFGSWEIAEGLVFRLLRRFWLAHFRFVRDASLAGARTLATRKVRLVLSPSQSPDNGRTPRHPIVVIPGIDGQRGSVAPLLDRLSAHRDVLLVDYATESASTLEELASEIGRLLPPKFDLVGQSIGTWIATLVANNFDSQVEKVVLVSTFLRARGMALRISALLTRTTPGPLYRVSTPWLMALVCGPVGDGRYHPFLAGVAHSDQKGVAWRTAWQIGRDFSSNLRGLSKPTLVIMGESDRFIPNRSLQIDSLRTIFERSHGHVVTVPHAGHVLLPTKAVEAATQHIEKFVG
jgi:pimeloyl-ACP methyl ester carboxylesterase